MQTVKTFSQSIVREHLPALGDAKIAIVANLSTAILLHLGVTDKFVRQNGNGALLLLYDFLHDGKIRDIDVDAETPSAAAGFEIFFKLSQAEQTKVLVRLIVAVHKAREAVKK